MNIFPAATIRRLITISLSLGLVMIAVNSMGCLRSRSPASQQGEQLYKTYCVACHGINGTGVLYPRSALNNAALVTGDPKGLLAVILFGREGAGTMPGWKTMLTDQEVAAVATYIRQAWSNGADPITPEMVQALRATGK